MAWMASLRPSARTSRITSRRFPVESGPITRILGWIGVGVEIDRHQLVLDRVQDIVLADAVLAGRLMDLHQRLS